MEITIRKYREDTKKYQCYQVVKGYHGIEGTIFIPKELETPEEIKVEIKDPAVAV